MVLKLKALVAKIKANLPLIKILWQNRKRKS